MAETSPALRLTNEGAMKILDAAMAKAAEMGVPQCISVVDAGGHLLAFSRMDGAFVLSIDSSLMKAMTAASYGEPTGHIPEGVDLKLAIATQGKRVNLPGGLPIVRRRAPGRRDRRRLGRRPRGPRGRQCRTLRDSRYETLRRVAVLRYAASPLLRMRGGLDVQEKSLIPSRPEGPYRGTPPQSNIATQSISTLTPLRCGVPPMQVRVTFSPCMNSVNASLKRGEVGDVAQANPHVDDVGEIRPRRLQDVPQIGERLTRLLRDVVGDDLAGLGVERALARDEQHVAEPDRLGERRRRRLVGEPGGRRARGGKDFLRHLCRWSSVVASQGRGITVPHSEQVRASSESKNLA